MPLINIISNADVSIVGYKLNSVFACILNVVVSILQTNCFRKSRNMCMIKSHGLYHHGKNKIKAYFFIFWLIKWSNSMYSKYK